MAFTKKKKKHVLKIIYILNYDSMWCLKDRSSRFRLYYRLKYYSTSDTLYNHCIM